jgi:hypothetical protein
MHDAVLVRSSMRTWEFTLLLGAGLVVLVGAGIAAAEGHGAAALALALLAGVCALAGVWGRRRRVRLRRWVQDMGAGFVIRDSSGERRVQDDGVLSMAIIHKENYVNGLLKSVTRRFVVWLATEDPKPERFEMTNTIAVGGADPLAGLISRLGDRLFQQAKNDLDAGRSVLGECWTLEDGVLSISHKDGMKTCRVQEVAAVQSVDAHLCIWQRDEEIPFAKVPTKTANAYLLMRLLDEQLTNRPTGKAPPHEDHLGRIIFERKPAKSSLVSLVVLSVAFFIAALVFAACAIMQLNLAFLALACLGAGVACSLGVLHCRRAAFRCHQYGVSLSGIRRTRVLRYADLEAFSYSAIRHFHHGAYTGTSLGLSFEPAAERKAERIRYNVTLRNADTELDNLRDQVSQMMAARMAQRLAAKQPADWTRRLRFLPEGIEYRPPGFFSRKEPVLVRYADIRHYTLEKGTFFLWVGDHKKPLVREATAARNFFPGYYLLTSMSQTVS